MSFEPLASADAVFLHIESDHEPRHVGSLSIIDGRPLRGAGGRIRLDETLVATPDTAHLGSRRTRLGAHHANPQQH